MLVDLVQTTTRDGLRLDGTYQAPTAPTGAVSVDAFCLVHGTGGNFYSSTLFDAFADRLLQMGCGVLRVNTRGHDGISTAATAKGGRRQGAAYEIVDDCRHDIAAWIAWLAGRAGQRVGLIGHSLGAVKCLYALAQKPDPRVACVIALSPPRLSYEWFCASPQAAAFLVDYHAAQQLVDRGEPGTLLDVKLPLPFVITAGGYVEKYGPDERYNYLRCLRGVSCPMLVTFGSIEVENNMAFRGAPEAIEKLRERSSRIAVTTVAGADHFYTGVRDDLLVQVESWLRASCYKL
ncbi:MAG: alpha/beta fold hydrolase [Planctomycetes bacterium]|nr:alpha/beta fold hydrolase [Planctomycetota bacterium]